MREAMGIVSLKNTAIYSANTNRNSKWHMLNCVVSLVKNLSFVTRFTSSQIDIINTGNITRRLICCEDLFDGLGCGSDLIRFIKILYITSAGGKDRHEAICRTRAWPCNP